MASSAGHICIPVMDSSEVVVVDINHGLPDEPEDLLEILAAEAAPLSTWYDFARAYLSQGKEAAFVHICNEGTRNEVVEEVEKFFGKKPTYEMVQFCCGLAALYIGKGKEEKDRAKRNELLNTAAKYLAQAKGQDPNEQLVHLGLGQLNLAKGEMGQARQEFSKAMLCLNNGRTNIAGMLALAGVLYNQKQLKEALALYRRALREHPSCPAEVRLGIAACCFRLGNMASAQAAYERVLQLDPECADALVGLAAVKFNSRPAVQQGMADGLALLTRAYEMDPTHVGTLNLLAHYCLLKGQYEKVLVLARSALELAESDVLKADCMLQLARAYHALGSFTEASNFYVQASRLDTSLALPHMGLAQMYLARGLDESSSINASSELESALKAAPAFYDALKILGQLIYDHPSKVEKTICHFKDAAAKQEEDPDIWELLAELLAPSDPAGSLKAYEHAVGVHRRMQAEVTRKRNEAVAKRRERVAAARKQKAMHEDDLFGSDDEDAEEDDEAADAAAAAAIPDHKVPSRLLNNAAVLFYRAGRISEAIDLMAEANACVGKEAKAAASERQATAADLRRLTLGYNTARLKEASGNYVQAKNVYEGILEEYPGYIDCYLRLSCIAHRTGDLNEALAWAQKALDMQGGHADALALITQLYMERREYKLCNDMIKKLLEDRANAKDSYGHLAYGNLNLALAPSDRKRDVELKKAEERLMKAYEEFSKVLRSEPSNVYAANGVGAVMAELGKLEAAREIFTEVQAAVASSTGFLSIPDVYINLANVALAKQEYTTAVGLYQVAMEKVDMTKKSSVLLYLARAHYDGGDLRAAKQHLLRCIHLAPTDYKVRFNVAVSMQEWAVRLYRKSRPANDNTKLVEYRQAQSELREALKIFEHLDAKGPETTNIDHAKLKVHIKFCKDQSKKSEVHVQAAEEEYNKLASKREAQDKLRQIAEVRRNLDELKRKEEQRRLEAEKQRRAKEALERAERVKENWRQRPELSMADDKDKKKGKGKKSKQDDGFIANEEEAYADSDEEGEKAVDAADQSGSGDDDAREDLMAQAGLNSDSEDEGGKRSRGAAEGSQPKRRKLQRAADADEGPSKGRREEDELMDEADEPAAGVDDLLDDNEEEGNTVKRVRRTALEDSDGEDEGNGNAGGDGDVEKRVDALFDGDDDDDEPVPEPEPELEQEPESDLDE